MANEYWKDEFRKTWARGISAWQSGKRVPESLWDLQDLNFLESIGCTAQELFDFVEDYCLDGEPDEETVLAVQEIRRKFFVEVMSSKKANRCARMEDLPPKSQPVDGITWLPRLIVKARLKLRGEMPRDLMYGCAGDRPFLKRMNSSLPEFLKLVRDCGDDDRKIIESLKRSAGL